MNLRGLLYNLHHFLSRFPIVVKLFIRLRNQIQCIIHHSLYDSAFHEVNGEKLLAKTIARECKTFVDVGANTGDYTEMFLQLGDAETISAVLYEPSGCANTEMSPKFTSPNVLIKQNAVGEIRQQMEYYEEAMSGESSSFLKGVSNSSAVKKVVEVVTLNEEFESLNWQRINFLKIDCEGYDFNVILGAERLLEKQLIDVIQFEYNRAWSTAGSTLEYCINYLGQFGYETYLLKKDGLHEFNHSVYGEFYAYANFVSFHKNSFPSVTNLIENKQ